MRPFVLRGVVTMLLCFFAGILVQGQETASPFTWKVSSEKVDDQHYKLIFTTEAVDGWDLYAPDQELGGIPMAVLEFPDTAVQTVAGFTASEPSEEKASEIFEGETAKLFKSGPVTWTLPVAIEGAVPAKLQGKLQYYYGKPGEFYPVYYEFTAELEGGVEASTTVKVASIDVKNPAVKCGDEATEGKSLWAIFGLGLLGGLVALLTPCVFPMIPVTVTFFTKKAKDKKKGRFNAIMYGLFIFLIYVAITIPFHLANQNPEIFNNISTNTWLNLIFFAVFVFFALSFFGLFELTLPSGLANRVDSKSGFGNLGGIFFMAATLTIVSFSCTGPLLGTLLVGVVSGGAWPLTVGAAGFGIALGLPFALFAMFPQWLQSLPKSGGWMTDVKVVLGFLEIALAIKFLSNADLVEQWGLLKRELFLGLWVLVSLLIVLYLLGILRIGHSSPVKKFSATRGIFVTIFAAVFIYLLTGLLAPSWNNLRLISGFLPPKSYSYFYDKTEKSDHFEPMHNQYEEALRLGREQNKPVLIDFTGWACVNCRRMEEKTWPDPVVDSLMRNEFVVVSLYVDERNNLPLTEQTTVTLSNGKEKKLVTVGDKWATFQTENFGATSQPQYAIISPDQKALTYTKYYTPDPVAFASWLECGLEAYRGKK